MLDLRPAATQMAKLVEGVRNDQLAGATPCPDYTLGDLVEHVGGLALVFTLAAQKYDGPELSQPPSPDASRLGADWRTTIPRQLAALGEAWRDPEAWRGSTRAGGVELSGEMAGLVALDELVIHGWDVARASGQPFECNPDSLEATHGFVSATAGSQADRSGLFGPVVDVPRDAPLIDRVIGLSGRDPRWTPGSTLPSPKLPSA